MLHTHTHTHIYIYTYIYITNRSRYFSNCLYRKHILYTDFNVYIYIYIYIYIHAHIQYLHIIYMLKDSSSQKMDKGEGIFSFFFRHMRRKTDVEYRSA